MLDDYDLFGNTSELEKILDSEEISLFDIHSKPYEIPENYEKIEVDIDSNDYDSVIREVCDDLLGILDDYGFSSSLYTGIYESILNAYQHGNNFNPEKNIEISYFINEDKFILNVKDEGKLLNGDFIDYYLDLKKNQCDDNFYEYSGKEMNDTNLGFGVKFMNTYFDNVRYFKSKDDGLIAHMYKEK
ncbi:MAG: ATP-binding protein [Candidatus Woesearchaeota archaeon]